MDIGYKWNKKVIYPVEDLKFAKVLWPWVKHKDFIRLIMLSSVWLYPNWYINVTILSSENAKITPTDSCILSTYSKKWVNHPDNMVLLPSFYYIMPLNLTTYIIWLLTNTHPTIWTSTQHKIFSPQLTIHSLLLSIKI